MTNPSLEPETPEVEQDTTPGEATISMSTTEAPAKRAPKPSKPVKPPKPVEPYAVVGAGATDNVLYSCALPEARAKTRKSLTIHHLQRRLKELGYQEAYADLDGRWGMLTTASVNGWLTDNGFEPAGDLTPEQFAAVFEGDINVTAVLDMRIG